MIPIVRRFEALPRQRQILLVLSPYVGALALLLFWFGRSSAVEVKPEEIRPEPLSGVLDVEASRSASPETTPAQVLRSSNPVEAPPAQPVEEAGRSTAEPLRGRVKVLPRASALFSRASGTARRIALLRNGHVLTVFDRFPAPDGWILARSEKGTVGFISLLHLQGQDDPRVEGRKRKRKRRRR